MSQLGPIFVLRRIDLTPEDSVRIPQNCIFPANRLDFADVHLLTALQFGVGEAPFPQSPAVINVCIRQTLS